MPMETLLDYDTGEIWYRKKKYRINTAYDNILRLQCMYAEEELDTGDKLELALKMLVHNSFKVWILSEQERAELLQKITQKYIQMPQKPENGTKKKIMDFRHDGAYIYASFRQAYGIDIIAERGKLSWHRFLNLLDGLPEKTKLREVMQIRAMEVPQPNGYNQKEIKNILELKSYYALPEECAGGQQGLDMLFSTLEGMAQ